MEEGLIYTDSRPRAKSTGHAFGFEGNLGMVLIVAAMVSIFILTMLFHANNPLPIPAKFVVAALPERRSCRAWAGIPGPRRQQVPSTHGGPESLPQRR